MAAGLAGVLAVGAATGGAWAGANRRDSSAQIRAVLAEQALATAQVGVSVMRLGGSGGGQVVFQANSETPLIPASNLKVITSAAAVEVLGGDFRFRTQLLLKDGDLYFLGDGDPTLGDPTLTRRIGWAYDTVFKQWAAELKRRGVGTVRHIYVDDSIFDDQRVHPMWSENQLHFAYSAEVAGLNYHFNTVEVLVRARDRVVQTSVTPPTGYVEVRSEVRVGEKPGISGARAQGSNAVMVQGEIRAGGEDSFAITISDPAMYAGTVLGEVLRREGVVMTGGVGRYVQTRELMAASAAGTFVPVGVLETPLSVVLGRCNKDSANLYAEALAKRLAAHAMGRPGSWEGNREAVGRFLRQIGVAEGQFVVDDGCGLSRGNRISADAMVRVLAREFSGPNRELFLASMAVGGVDGTLRSRFTDDLRGRVLAKSGYINQVFALSGYLRARDGQWYAFAILFNGANGVRPLHERIVQAIDAGAW